MAGNETSLGRRDRLGVAALVLLGHLMVLAALVRTFTPGIADRVVRASVQAFNVHLDPPSPPPSLAADQTRPTPGEPQPEAAARREGVSGAAGREAAAREVTAPLAPIVIAAAPAPLVAGHGEQDRSGAQAAGDGPGGAGAGRGMGAGATGSGRGGGGAAAPTVKIAGEINSARDYPHASRALRIGSAVVIDLSVDTRGRVDGCRVFQPSPDAQADAITCRLATERFRFRPARDARGNPIEAVFRWRQRWFT